MDTQSNLLKALVDLYPELSHTSLISALRTPDALRQLNVKQTSISRNQTPFGEHVIDLVSEDEDLTMYEEVQSNGDLENELEVSEPFMTSAGHRRLKQLGSNEFDAKGDADRLLPLRDLNNGPSSSVLEDEPVPPALCFKSVENLCHGASGGLEALTCGPTSSSIPSSLPENKLPTSEGSLEAELNYEMDSSTRQLIGNLATSKSEPRFSKPLKSQITIPAYSSTHALSTNDIPALAKIQDDDFVRNLHDVTSAVYVRFHNNFSRYKLELTANLFQVFNRSVFSNSLSEDMVVTWNTRLLRTAGRTTYKRKGFERTAAIELSVKVCDTADRVVNTLLHEMCHAVVWIRYGIKDAHGKAWKYWAQYASNCYPYLPPVTRCHSYEIRAKYTYKCQSCHYELKRHSKSLDVNKYRCGKCHGKFLLLPSTSATPSRTPNAFAMFVKENYSTQRKTDPKLSHREVMVKLGEEFKEKAQLKF